MSRLWRGGLWSGSRFWGTLEAKGSQAAGKRCAYSDSAPILAIGNASVSGVAERGGAKPSRRAASTGFGGSQFLVAVKGGVATRLRRVATGDASLSLSRGRVGTVRRPRRGRGRMRLAGTAAPHLCFAPTGKSEGRAPAAGLVSAAGACGRWDAPFPRA